MKRNPTEQLVLGTLKADPAVGPDEELTKALRGGVDWSVAIDRLFAHGLSGLLYRVLVKHNANGAVPQKVMDRLREVNYCGVLGIMIQE